MNKLIGAVMVIIGTTTYGILASNSAMTRIRNLKLLKKVLTMLSAQISYSVSTLPEALESIGARMENTFIYTFLINVSHRLKEMQGKNFRVIWNECIDEFLQYSNLSRSDIEQLKTLGDNLGYLDKDMHINTINLYMEQLQRDIDSAGEEIGNKCRIYRCMGVASGIVLAIILV